MADEDLVTIGRVVRPHGVRGEVAVEAAGDALAALEPGDVVMLDPGRERAVTGLRPHAGRWLLLLEGIEDRDAAEELRGSLVRLQAERLPELAEGDFYVDDLLGARVDTVDGACLGEVIAIHEGAAQDLLELRLGSETALVPMVRDWLVEVDLDAGHILMDVPPGLVEISDAGKAAGEDAGAR